MSTATKNDAVALVASLGVVATLAVTGWFGRGEFVLLSSRLWHATWSLVRPVRCEQRHGPREHGTNPRFAAMGDSLGHA